MYYQIKTERLFLRPLNITDLETVHEYASNNENTMYMQWLPNKTLEETAEFLSGVTKEWEKETPSFYEFAIELNGIQIGAISVYLDDNRESGALGWILNKKYWNNGYATEAAMALRDFALNVFHIKKLTANCDHRNTASSRVMEKIGLELERDNDIRVYPKRNETARELTYSLIV
ncbi:MAG: GNAT family N-acetyltransferase [Oscillospiraceae bacterium]|nr:GNAT family N-acetyltransferase [Oscillospiraceae bacterium]